MAKQQITLQPKNAAAGGTLQTAQVGGANALVAQPGPANAAIAIAPPVRQSATIEAAPNTELPTPVETAWGEIIGNIADQTDLITLVNNGDAATLASANAHSDAHDAATLAAAEAYADAGDAATLATANAYTDTGIAGVNANLNNRVAKSGDNMFGDLTLATTGGNTALRIDKGTGAANYARIDVTRNATMRWRMNLANATTESGGNAGSDWALERFSDAGASLGAALTVTRSTGAVAMPGPVTTGQAAVDNRVDINALTGQDANLLLHKPASGRRNQVVGYTGATAQRWAIIPGDEVAESGSDAGSNFKVERYTDAAVTYNALQILRKNGYVVVGRGAVRAAALTDAEGGVSNIEMNAVASGTGNYITTNVAGNLRWQLKLGNGSAETGSNAGSNFAISRYADNGTLLGDVMSILRSNGDVGFSTGSVTLGSLGASVGLSLSKTAGANIASITSYTGGSARWQMQLSNGAVESGGNAGSDFALYRYNDAGAVIDTALSISRSNGYIYSGAGSGFFAGPTIGFRTNSYQSASGNFYAMMTAANPNWNDVYFQAFHAPGIEAGLYLALVTTGTWKWANNGNAYAPGAWVDSSDMRVKTDRARIASARSIIAGLTGYTYRRTDLSNMDGSPVLDAGLLGQDIDAVLPVAVSKSERRLPDGTVIPDFHNVNYNGVTAALVEDNNGLAARIEQLEAALNAALARITQLEGASA